MGLLFKYSRTPRNGWVSQSGRWFVCGWAQHSRLAKEMGSTEEELELTHIKVSDDGSPTPTLATRQRRITKAQENALLDAGYSPNGVRLL